MDPISLFMAATAAFNTVKKLVEAGREVEDVLGQIGSWMGKVSELNALDNKKPSIFKWLNICQTSSLKNIQTNLESEGSN